ncbi:MAG TPA: polysaccharide biosynthesis/export family protein [Myxococcota bacterium]|nr:polysaccharide biosynthesis/export family protein [Myxococcota bacterium]
MRGRAKVARICFSLALGVAPSTCRHAKAPALAPTPGPLEGSLTLGTNDVFEVHVFNEPDLSGTYRVGTDGHVTIPLAGRIEVAGLSPEKAGALIAEQLSAYVKAPQVNVFVKEFNSKKVYVFGEVKNPGTFVFTDGMSIIQAVTQAGGFDKLADKDGTFVTRRQEGMEQHYKVSVKEIVDGRADNFLLKPGDIVYVPETFF